MTFEPIPVTNAIIGTPSWTEHVTWTGGGWSPDYPLPALNRLPLSYVARSTDLDPAHTQMWGTLDKPRHVRLVVVCRHSISINGRVKVTLYGREGDNPFSHALWQSEDIEVWPAVFASLPLPWSTDNWWSGKYAEEDSAGYNWYLPVLADMSYPVSGLRVEIFDPANPSRDAAHASHHAGHPEGYVDVGRIEVADIIRPSFNFSVGAEEGFDDLTESMRAKGGVKYCEQGPLMRIFNGEFAWLDRDEARMLFGEFKRRHGLSRPFFWWPEPQDGREMLRTAFLARNSALPRHRYATSTLHSVPVSFEEVI